MRNIPKNYIRLCAVVSAYKSRFQEWPSLATIGPMAIADISETLNRQEWDELNRILPIHVDPSSDWGIQVESGSGHRLTYTGFSDEGHRDAEVYLGDVFAGSYSIQ